MVEAPKPGSIPDGQVSDTGIQNALVSSPAVRMNSQERAYYLAQKFRQQQDFYQSAKLEGALEISLSNEKQKVLQRHNIIMERVLVGGENFETVAAEYGRNEQWARSEFRAGLIRLWGKSSLQLQEKFPQGTIIPVHADTRRRKSQRGEDDLVEQLQREDLSSKEEVEKMMQRVGYRFYLKHKDFFIKLSDLVEKEGFQVEEGYSIRIMQMISDLLSREGIVVKEMSLENNTAAKQIHIIWSGDFDEAIDIFNEHLRPFVESIISY